MSSDARERYVRTVLAGHHVDSPNVEIHIELGESCCSVFGHSVSFVNAAVPLVTLYSDDSTPQAPTIHPDAGRMFEEAAMRLIGDGTEFYTVLRPTWALRALLWTREYR